MQLPSGKRSLVLLATLAVLLFKPLSPALAASPDDFHLTTSPLPILLTAKPGTTTSTDLRVENSGVKPATIHVSLMKFKSDNKDGRPQLAERGPGDDYFDWVSFNTTSFTADPNVWNEVKMTINVPKDAGLGYYYAVVFSRQDPKATPNSPSSQLQGGTAILVLLDVPTPGEKKALDISSFSASKKLYEYLPATFTTNVANVGNIHLSPNGTIFISKGSKAIAAIDFNPGGGNILPSSARQFTATWNDGFPVFQTKMVNGQIVSDKNSKPVTQLHWDFSKVNKLRIGHYSARLVMTYDNGQRDVPVTATVSFWVLPWKLLLLFLLILAMIGLGLFIISHNIYRRIKSANKN